jgi:hypothetical protein
MGAFRKIGKVIQGPPIIIKAIPATSPVKIDLAECIYRTGFDAFSAFLTGFKQAGLIGLNQRMVSQFSLSHETSKPARAPDGGNQQVIDAKPPQVHQVG